ncbi:MAG: F0F1 ATP synthase subunit gamma [Phyllobacteriaceae bacterium]|nr:F0F1 ATP synthase subunit gamma [Phyllobacteriaceae bacterium]
MPSLKDLRNRITSIKATRKITKAMQMVSAAKLRRAQDAAEAARPYSQRMEAVLANIASAVSGEDAPRLMAGSGASQTHLLLVCTSERGLCGGFNTQIVRLAREQARRLIADGKTVKIFCVGKKGYDQLRRDFADRIVERMEFKDVKQIGFAQASKVADRVIAMFNDGAFDVCTLYFSVFKSVIQQIPTAQQLIPASVPVVADADTGSKNVYEYEPDASAILTDLIPRNIAVQIFKGLLENAASEQGARMSAMDSATRNAGDMINRLTLSYNRQRQAQITKELIEIISGAEAL